MHDMRLKSNDIARNKYRYTYIFLKVCQYLDKMITYICSLVRTVQSYRLSFATRLWCHSTIRIKVDMSYLRSGKKTKLPFYQHEAKLNMILLLSHGILDTELCLHTTSSVPIHSPAEWITSTNLASSVLNFSLFGTV